MKSPLENCPLCGGNIELDKCLLQESQFVLGYITYRIYCPKCKITTSRKYLNKLDAIIAWNDLSKRRKR